RFDRSGSAPTAPRSNRLANFVGVEAVESNTQRLIFELKTHWESMLIPTLSSHAIPLWLLLAAEDRMVSSACQLLKLFNDQNHVYHILQIVQPSGQVVFPGIKTPLLNRSTRTVGTRIELA